VQPRPARRLSWQRGPRRFVQDTRPDPVGLRRFVQNQEA